MLCQKISFGEDLQLIISWYLFTSKDPIFFLLRLNKMPPHFTTIGLAMLCYCFDIDMGATLKILGTLSYFVLIYMMPGDLGGARCTWKQKIRQLQSGFFEDSSAFGHLRDYWPKWMTPALTEVRLWLDCRCNRWICLKSDISMSWGRKQTAQGRSNQTDRQETTAMKGNPQRKLIFKTRQHNHLLMSGNCESMRTCWKHMTDTTTQQQQQAGMWLFDCWSQQQSSRLVSVTFFLSVKLISPPFYNTALY